MLYNFALEYTTVKVQENQTNWNWMEHISFWSMMTMLLYWIKNKNMKINTSSVTS
jgi:hypothetical protein